MRTFRAVVSTFAALATAAVFVGAGAAPSVVATPDAPPADSSTASAPARPAGGRTARDLVDEYLGRAPGVPGVVPRIRTLVVVLPDPLDSRLDWMYDAGLEATRGALERGGYVLDRFWLPWTGDADQVRRDRGTSAQPGRRATWPGVIVFRQAGGTGRTPELLVAWIVGESPTAGVHRAAFDSALADRDALLRRPGALADADRAGAGDDPALVRIVGPVFSGSIPSLRARLDAWLSGHDGARAVVVSGGATGGRNRALMMQGTDRITFVATVNPVDSLVGVLRTTIEQRFGIPPQQIAYVTESNTAYGRMAARSDAPGVRATDASLLAAADSLSLQLPFPLSISRLRAEYARHPPASRDAAALPGAPAPSRIPLELEDPASATENFPALSELTAPALERALDDIAQTLLAHKIRMVVIVATDIRDRLFLADEVKRRLRDAKLALVGSHALYSRPDVNESLRGAIVASTYPLFLENQYWDRTQFGERRRQVFTSDLAEGTFNATLLQIGRAGDMVDYAAPGDTLDRLRPPVWLTIVGRTSLAPLLARPLAWSDAHAPDPEACATPIAPRAAGPRPAGDVALYVALRCDTATARLARLARQRPSGPEPRVLQLGLDDVALPFTTLVLFAGALLLARITATFPTAAPMPASASGAAAPGVVGPATRADTGDGAPGTLRLAWRAVVRAFRFSSPWPAFGQDVARWRFHQLTLTLHGRVWAIVQAVGIGAVFAPVLLALLRPRMHTVPAPGMYSFGAEALVLGGLALLVWPHVRTALPSLAAVLPRLRGARAATPDSVPHREEQLFETASGSLLAAVLLGGAAAYLGAVSWLLLRIMLLPPLRSGPFVTRYLQWFSGVTPLVPLVLGSALLVTWSAWHLRRTRALDQAHAFEAATGARAGDRGSGRRSEALPDPRAGLLGFTPGRTALVPLGLLALLGLYVLLMLERTPEVVALGALPYPGRQVERSLPGAFDVVYRIALLALLWSSGWSVLRFTLVWGALRTRLRRLTDASWIDATSRLPNAVTRLTRLTPLGGPRAEWVDEALDAAARDRWRRLRSHAPDHLDALAARMELSSAGPVPRLGDGGPPRLRVALHRGPAAAAAVGYALDVLLDDLATGGPTRLSPVAMPPAAGDAPARLLVPPARPDRWRADAQELVALYAVDWVEWVVRHLRDLALFQLAALLLGTLFLSSYPFEPQTLVKTVFFGLMALTIGALLAALVQMNRDEVLSRITRTDVGKMTWDLPFVTNLVVVTIVPVLTILGSQFPELRNFLFSWVTPLLRVLGRG